MSLLFGAVSTDRIEAASSATLDDVNPFTMLLWVYCTTRTDLRDLMTKGSATGYKVFRLSGATGNLQLIVDRATADADFRTNTTPLALNTWTLVAATYDGGASPTTHIYTGTLAAVAVEATYAISNSGSGGTVTDATIAFGVGNTPNGIGNTPFQGRIAVAAYISGALTLPQIISWQFRPRVIADTRVFYIPGYNGVGTQPDLSGKGNAGTVTGATVTDHVPLSSPLRRDVPYSPYTPASAAATSFRRTLSGLGTRTGSRQVHGRY